MKPTKPIYVANCIEAGEGFFTMFQTNETNKQKLYEMGQEHASTYGGECISVKKWTPKITKKAKLFDKKDNKWIDDTERKINNFVKKHPKTTRYDYSKTQYFTITEEMPKDVWDNDLSSDENLKGVVK